MTAGRGEYGVARQRQPGRNSAAMGYRVTLKRGVELFNAGLYWEAHEAWELAWTPDRLGPDRGFYKGLIQIAAGCLHYRRDNRRGAINKWRSGTAYLRSYLPLYRG
ncbi:MAG: DUF309 domain-containing protein, partial [Chloroflexi bacterium]